MSHNTRQASALLAACIVFLLSPVRLPVHAESPGTALIEAAREAWSQREEEGRTLAAIALYQQALKADPSHPEWLIELTRALNRTVRQTPSMKEKKHWTDRAEKAAQQAVRENPRSPQAHAYYAEALGQWAQTHRGFSALKRVKRAVEHLQMAVNLDPQYGYAHMLLASFYRSAPKRVSVGDKKKALLHAQRAAEVEPTRAINLLTLAKVLSDDGRREEAKDALRKAIALNPPEDAIPETKADQAAARELLKGLTHEN